MAAGKMEVKINALTISLAYANDMMWIGLSCQHTHPDAASGPMPSRLQSASNCGDGRVAGCGAKCSAEALIDSSDRLSSLSSKYNPGDRRNSTSTASQAVEAAIDSTLTTCDWVRVGNRASHATTSVLLSKSSIVISDMVRSSTNHLWSPCNEASTRKG
jgi:hypothetical protein